MMVGIFGAGGFAREVMELYQSDLENVARNSQVVFVDLKSQKSINGYDVWDEISFLNYTGEKSFIAAIADPIIRKDVFTKAILSGAKAIHVHASKSELLKPNDIREGSVICSHSTVSVNTRIGRGFHLNFHSYVAHDCVIGDFVTIGPHVTCAGGVEIRDFVKIGAGAVIRNSDTDNKIVIGEGAVIGMGAIVTRSIPRASVAFGNPARLLGNP